MRVLMVEIALLIVCSVIGAGLGFLLAGGFMIVGASVLPNLITEGQSAFVHEILMMTGMVMGAFWALSRIES